jgi:dihydroflavonol-4-reductase
VRAAVGSAVARALVDAGYSVRALVRSRSPRGNLTALDIEIAEGDMLDAESVDRAMAGVRYVMHVAADYRLWSRDREEIRHNNLSGTRIVMEAALREGVERVVYTSSVAALALRVDGAAADESIALAEHAAVEHKRSGEAQDLVDDDRAPRCRRSLSSDADRAAGHPADTHWKDHRRSRVGTHARVCRHRTQPGSRRRRRGRTPGGAEARQDRRAVHPGRPGRAAGRHAARHRRTRRAPPAAPQGAAAAALSRGRSGGEWLDAEGPETFLTLDGRMARKRMYFSSEKATRELGYSARPYGEGLQDAVEWFRAGHLK